MGLDQYAYAATRAKQQEEWWDGATMDKEVGEFVNPKITRPRELAYWRKHPNLQGWMEQLWTRKLAQAGETPGTSDFGSTFNGVELELTHDDLDELERAVTQNQLPDTKGFFFGDPSDDYYKQQDLEFIKNARAELFCGLKVFYNSSW